MAAQNAINGPKLFMHVAGRPRMVPAVTKHVLPDVRDGQDIYDASASDAILHLQEWDVKDCQCPRDPMQPASKKKITPRNGMMTSLWVTNFAWRDAGQLVLYTPGGVRHMSASDVSPFHPLPACFTPLSDTCPLAFWFGLCLCGVCVFVLVGCVSLSCFCKWQSSFQVSSVIQLQVTDNASMLARLGDKKKSRQRNVRSMLSANFRLICGPAGIRAGEQSVSERSKGITKPTRPQRRLFPYRLQQISRTQAVHN